VIEMNSEAIPDDSPRHMLDGKPLRVFRIRSRRYGKRVEAAAATTKKEAARLMGVSPSTLSSEGVELFHGENYDRIVASPGITFMAHQGGTPEERSFVPEADFVKRVYKNHF